MNNSDQSFEQVQKNIQNDANILGFVLLGSRGKGFENEFSDYDALLVVKDEVMDEYKTKHEVNNKNMDLGVQGLSEFRNYAKWGSPEASGERYDYTHCKILLDRTGEITQLVAEKGMIPKERQHGFVYGALDAYINGVFRSAKAWRNNNPIGAQLEAMGSIEDFLDALFGLYGRPRPYRAYLGKELEKYPLENMPWESKELIQILVSILQTGDLRTQQNLLKQAEQFFRAKGFGKVFDEWEGKDKWAMELELP